MSSDSAPFRVPLRAPRALRSVPRAVTQLRTRPELAGVLVIAGVLNLWGLSINGWANTYYSAAVRSMSTSWHDFLFVSLDKSGLMTVDKPPLSLWVQALSARVFGFHPLSLLVPQALMGVAAVALLYDRVRRRFGRGRVVRPARARDRPHPLAGAERRGRGTWLRDQDGRCPDGRARHRRGVD